MDVMNPFAMATLWKFKAVELVTEFVCIHLQAVVATSKRQLMSLIDGSIVVQKMQLEVTRFQQDQRPLKPNDQFKRYIHCKKWQQFFCI
ncbi:hypothetical protein L5515_016576 [Caenorhabditis briggsae]|uniref:Uncharacterized protein n=1 Tax=Caenorhabditis briggsae TaxID=6238 RepID=A0AAE9FCH8_CAEBR|nr:hypothetical protein L5515_016576 [Caenorhabditis briggsae]